MARVDRFSGGPNPIDEFLESGGKTIYVRCADVKDQESMRVYLLNDRKGRGKQYMDTIRITKDQIDGVHVVVVRKREYQQICVLVDGKLVPVENNKVELPPSAKQLEDKRTNERSSFLMLEDLTRLLEDYQSERIDKQQFVTILRETFPDDVYEDVMKRYGIDGN